MSLKGSARYRTTKFLGEGTFAEVFAAIDLNHPEKMTVAIKKFKPPSNYRESRDGVNRTAMREIKIQKELKHKNVMRLLDVFSKEGATVSLVFEFMKTDLADILADLNVVITPANAKCLILQTFIGLDYMHQNWIIHRDLKPGNLLLDVNGVLKIGDFGLAKTYGSPNREMTSQVVTPWYKAPELLLGAKHYSTSIDIWSMGCIMAEIVKRRPFFQTTNTDTGEHYISDMSQLTTIFGILGTPNEESWPGYESMQNFIKFNEQVPQNLLLEFDSSEFVDLMQACFRFNPLGRISCKEACMSSYFTSEPLPSLPENLPGIRVDDTSPEDGRKGRKRKREAINGEVGETLADNLPRVAKKLLF